MRAWSADQLARVAGARRLARAQSARGPERVVIDSREAGPGVLFVGLAGKRVDGGRFAAQALAAGAWGVLVAHEYAAAVQSGAPGAVLAADDPLPALQRLARAWRRELGAKVIGVTGSTGKTSTKDLLMAVLAPHRRTVASRENYNTEIGLPLEILGAPAESEILVLEMAMRGPGQIAELAAVAEPDVGVIVSIGPVHLELLGTVEAIAAAKAELIAALAPGATAIVPAGERLLEPHLRADLETVTFGEDGDVRLLRSDAGEVEIDLVGEAVTLAVPFTQAHLRRNLLAAVAAARAVGVVPDGRVELVLSAGRGERVALPDGVTLIDDCYNANPVSMRAALDELAAASASSTATAASSTATAASSTATAAGTSAPAAGTTATAARTTAAATRSPGAGRCRRVAVLGDMLELGAGERDFHVEVGRHAGQAGVEVLVTVGPLARWIADGFPGEAHCVDDAVEAAELLPELISPGDVVLVKGSRGVGLELVCRALGTPAGVRS